MVLKENKMVTIYIKGSAEIIEGVSVDYAVVEESEIDALLMIGWVKEITHVNEDLSS